MFLVDLKNSSSPCRASYKFLLCICFYLFMAKIEAKRQSKNFMIEK
ncbi:hypothetical protein ENTCAN_05469 [Enterobacter cancerogenus ATCC 35316]|nr:hypothetical protein ENTCAN_05469 [Enterobacter cancerogenus ATCC 35316]